MREIYLDNAATTPCDSEVLKTMRPYWSKVYGNPSSFNDAGRKAKKAVDQSRKKIALILGAKPQEIIFTSSATEANNLAILGTARKKLHIITTSIEHQSVLEPIKKLEQSGLEVTYLPVNRQGLLNTEEFKKSLKSRTVLVSIIYANNEIGSVQPVKKISKIIKTWKLKIGDSPYPLFHIDASQAAGHLDINANNLDVDLMTISSHKIYGPKGVAFLYARTGVKIDPLLLGGGQEQGLRSSTEAVPLIIGLEKALKLSSQLKVKNKKKGEELRNYFIAGLKKLFPEARINGPEDPKERVPHIVSATFPEVENEQLLLHLDKLGIRASAGSACASKSIDPSHVLSAIGLSESQARSTVRFSFGDGTAKTDLAYVLSILPKVVKKIKKLYPEYLRKQYYK